MPLNDQDLREMLTRYQDLAEWDRRFIDHRGEQVDRARSHGIACWCIAGIGAGAVMVLAPPDWKWLGAALAGAALWLAFLGMTWILPSFDFDAHRHLLTGPESGGDRAAVSEGARD